jgi:transcription elongation factor Elf1
MKFTCPYCGNNSFIVTNDHAGLAHATCGKCAKVIPFEKYMMTNSPVSEGAQVEPDTHPERIH